MTIKRPTRARRLMDKGYAAAQKGKPCVPPAAVTRELDRAAWEQGWQAGYRAHREAKAKQGDNE